MSTLLYFHENQFAYPENQGRYGLLEAQMVSIYSALAADCLAFNSNYNLESFLQGVSRLLSKLPDHVPAGIEEQLRSKSRVLPVPIFAEISVPRPKNHSDSLTIVWNHRWEYDKGPDRLLKLLGVLEDADNAHYLLHIIGQQFRSLPDEFESIKTLIDSALNLSLGHWGFVESEKHYWEILSASDVVLSTAIHDFQGLSVLEAVAAGCSPVVPDRLAYRELFESCHRYHVDESNLEVEVESALKKLEKLAGLKISKQQLPVPSVGFLSPAVLKGQYLSCFESLIEATRQNQQGAST